MEVISLFNETIYQNIYKLLLVLASIPISSSTNEITEVIEEFVKNSFTFFNVKCETTK